MGRSARCGREDENQNYRPSEIAPLWLIFLVVYVPVMVCHAQSMSQSRSVSSSDRQRFHQRSGDHGITASLPGQLPPSRRGKVVTVVIRWDEKALS
jgi:hypothetical protein